MLNITVPSIRLWNPETEEFTYTSPVSLQLEHSLISLAKWEARWHKPFLTSKQKTPEELLDYIRCMTLTQNVDPDLYKKLPPDIIDKIVFYMNEEQHATTFGNTSNERPSREVVTAEIIYYWMVTFGIPFECQKWHLSRLMALVKVCSIKNSPQKKMTAREIQTRNRALNDARRKSMHTRG